MLSLFNKKKIVNSSVNDQSQDLAHINQEIYKKSLELSERNKTLLLLRKIDEIILSSVTDKNEIARKVTEILVTETDFQLASIFIYDKKKDILERLAFYETSKIFAFNQKNSLETLYLSEIMFSEPGNILFQSVRGKNPTSTSNLQNALLSQDNSQAAAQIQEFSGIKSICAFPLIVRDEVSGVIAVALSDFEADISEYIRDLLLRLSQVIGIAIDNASLYTQLQDANKKLKALDKLKDEFVYLASHELRTPMTAIKSYLWMTLQQEAGILNDTQKLYINRAYSSVERLIKLVNDMLNISRIESGRITIEMKKVNLYQLVEEVVQEVQPRAAELGVNIVITPTISLPDVFADADKIKEVLFNLIGNSLKFTPKDGSITISFVENKGMIETKIQDTGSGISQENIEKLFQKFSMLSDSYANNKSASGSGLGLYISKSIVEMHRGKIWVVSEGLGKGSLFIFSLQIFNQDEQNIYASQQNGSDKPQIGIVHTQI